MQSKERPYVLYVAEIIYKKIYDIKKKNPSFTNIDAIEGFIGTASYKKISSGQFHDEWFENLKKMILLTSIQKKEYLKKQLNF